MVPLDLILGIGGLVVGSFLGYFFYKTSFEKKNKDLAEKSKNIIKDAESKAKELLIDAKNESIKIQDKAKESEFKKREELEAHEERLLKKEVNLDKKIDQLEKVRENLDEKSEAIKEKKKSLEQLITEQEVELSRVASMSKDEAREALFNKIEEDVREDLAEQVVKTEKMIKEELDEKAKNMIADAIQRVAADITMESTATIVDLPSDDLKGRIIGREGRNINTFEHISGIDVIVDDTPGSILIVGFDLKRREIAKRALEKLISDGRIHPARIEEVLEKSKTEIDKLVVEKGEKAAFEADVSGLNTKLIKLLGELNFRTNFGQNVLKQSVAVSLLSASIAADLGADVEVCSKAGLLHAIGKAANHEIKGHHSKIGADIAKKHGLSEKIVNAIAAVEEKVQANSLEAKIIQVAYLISISREGVQKENLENFIKRMVELENFISANKNVEKVFAIQAGKAVRVFAKPDRVDDKSMIAMSHKLTKEIERNFQFAGPVKVEIIREVRAEALAK